MASTATDLRISDLPKRHASALRRKAERMGFRKALKGASEEEIARIVAEARPRRRR